MGASHNVPSDTNAFMIRYKELSATAHSFNCEAMAPIHVELVRESHRWNVNTAACRCVKERVCGKQSSGDSQKAWHARNTGGASETCKCSREARLFATIPKAKLAGLSKQAPNALPLKTRRSARCMHASRHTKDLTRSLQNSFTPADTNRDRTACL